MRIFSPLANDVVTGQYQQLSHTTYFTLLYVQPKELFLQNKCK